MGASRRLKRRKGDRNYILSVHDQVMAEVVKRVTLFETDGHGQRRMIVPSVTSLEDCFELVLEELMEEGLAPHKHIDEMIERCEQKIMDARFAQAGRIKTIEYPMRTEAERAAFVRAMES